MTYKKLMTRMVAMVIVGWVVVIVTSLSTQLLDKLDTVPSMGVLILITSIMLAGTITLLVGMIGGFVVYVEHKLNGPSKKEDDVS